MRSCTTSTNAAVSWSVTASRARIGRHVETGPVADDGRVGVGHHPELRPCLGGEDLHLEPVGEAGLVGEQAGDLRRCVALYQAGAPSCRTLYEPEAPSVPPRSVRVRDRVLGTGERRARGVGPDVGGGARRVANCTKHWTEHAVAQCAECGQHWCAQCLVPPVRDKDPLRCIPCSLVLAGVRTRRRVEMTATTCFAVENHGVVTGFRRQSCSWSARVGGDVEAVLRAGPADDVDGRVGACDGRRSMPSPPR